MIVTTMYATVRVRASARLTREDQIVQLVEFAQTGDAGAFRRLYRRFREMVHGLLLTKVPLRDVDDLGQEVFVKAHANLGMLRDPRKFGPWLRQITRNVAASHMRGRGRSLDLPNDVDALSQPQSSMPPADALALLAALRRLPESYCEVLILRFVEGLTGPEISAQTGMTEGSVRVKLHRGVEMLRKILQEGRAHG